MNDIIEMETVVPNIENVEQKKVKQIELVLEVLKLFVVEFDGNINLSKEMLGTGAMTALSDQIGQTIENPLHAMFRVSNDIDNNIKRLINQITVAFLRQKKDIINDAYVSKTPDNSLYYSLVLNKDDFNSRDSIFSFYDKYDLLEISSKYPVHFQFMTSELIGKRYNYEKVDLAKA